MNLKLCAVKNIGAKQPHERIQLVVVDLDKSKRYPLNFVCVLPRYFRILERRSSKFAKIFGPKTLPTARNLLEEAAHAEEDPEIKTVIKKRIKDIDAKAYNQPQSQN
ncbi:MAG: hypothetical protein ACM3UY_00125 [Methanocella sp.]